MRNYRVEYKDIRDDLCTNIVTVEADLFILSDDNVAVTFFVENANSSMTPVAMYPFASISCINTEPAEESDKEE